MLCSVGQGKFEDAGPLYLRAIDIAEKALGPDHPTLASMLNNRAAVLMAQVITYNRTFFCAYPVCCLVLQYNL